MFISLFDLFKLLGLLSLLMYGMKIMSESLQKMAGPQLRRVLQTMTSNRFFGMLTGVFVTASVHSSTATTVMTVSFVNAGLLTLTQAISIIMGANIGTTLTAWIMSAGFTFNITDLVYVAFSIAILLIYSKKRKVVGEFLFGIAFMFLALGTLRQTGIDMNLSENQAVLDFFSSFDPTAFSTTVIFLLIGSLMTAFVHSSAAIMAITMILCSSGVLPIYQGIALVMGENIGTTATSIIAALTANTQARRAAFAHMFFNLFGVLWMLCVFTHFVDAVCSVLGFDVTLKMGDEGFLENATKLSFVLAAFHSAFNLTNTFILIWFVPQIEKIVCWFVKPRTGDEEDEGRLRFISSTLMETAELSVLQASKETALFAGRTMRMFGMVEQLLQTTNDEEFNKLFSRIEKYENICDNMEIEIANYLSKVSEGRLSPESKSKIRIMLRVVSELESIGDSCYNMARTVVRVRELGETLNEQQFAHIQAMLQLDRSALERMIQVLDRPEDMRMDVNKSYNIEREMNNLRDQLKKQNILDVNSKTYNYQLGVYYMDFVSECERLGDYVVNVVEASTESEKKM